MQRLISLSLIASVACARTSPVSNPEFLGDCTNNSAATDGLPRDATTTGSCTDPDLCIALGRCRQTSAGCIADSVKDCKASLFCPVTGKCGLADGKCSVTVDADCATLCAIQGKCKAQQGRCVATAATCGFSKECLFDGRCVAVDGECIADSASCLKSSQCFTQKECVAFFGKCYRYQSANCKDCFDDGRCASLETSFQCFAVAEEDCQKSKYCKLKGNCSLSSKLVCEALKDADCVGSEACQKNGLCHALGDGNCGQ